MRAILWRKIKPALIKLPLTIMVGATANASKGSVTKNTSESDAIPHSDKVKATAHASKDSAS